MATFWYEPSSAMVDSKIVRTRKPVITKSIEKQRDFGQTDKSHHVEIVGRSSDAIKLFSLLGTKLACLPLQTFQA
jgi:hypothetical protein